MRVSVIKANDDHGMYVCRVVEHVTLVFCLGLRSSKQGVQRRARQGEECGVW